MKTHIAGLLALGLLLSAAPGMAQTTTPSNPRSNPTNDTSGPRSTEPRTDTTPSAGTPAAERPASAMDPMKPDSSTKKPNKTSSGMGKSSDRVDVTRTTDLPESQSRSNDAVIADPPSGVSNTDPNLQPKNTTRPAGEANPKP
ncbi:MAG: hypothetical protein KME03_02240 [Aphanocapsa lilacina HA4352-LM1]|jgi:hypothetical protein|nr:hypothetical protein [Aphanocapsa lilacina HA4352-LM1]